MADSFVEMNVDDDTGQPHDIDLDLEVEEQDAFLLEMNKFCEASEAQAHAGDGPKDANGNDTRDVGEEEYRGGADADDADDGLGFGPDNEVAGLV